MSSSGEMKMSLKLMTCKKSVYIYIYIVIIIIIVIIMGTYIFMSQVLEQLELSIGPLGQDRRAERLHDLLDGDGLVCQLVFGGAAQSVSPRGGGGYWSRPGDIYQTSPKAPMPTGCRSEYLQEVSKRLYTIFIVIFISIFYLHPMRGCRRTWW